MLDKGSYLYHSWFLIFDSKILLSQRFVRRGDLLRRKFQHILSGILGLLKNRHTWPGSRSVHILIVRLSTWCIFFEWRIDFFSHPIYFFRKTLYPSNIALLLLQRFVRWREVIHMAYNSLPPLLCICWVLCRHRSCPPRSDQGPHADTTRVRWHHAWRGTQAVRSWRSCRILQRFALLFPYFVFWEPSTRKEQKGFTEINYSNSRPHEFLLTHYLFS